MRCYVINLEAASDRRRAMRDLLAPTGIDFEFFPAITPITMDRFFSNLSTDLIFRMETGRKNMEPKEYACYASHLSLWQRCAELNEPVMVLEDDIKPEKDFQSKFDFISETVGKYGFIRLETHTPEWNYFRGKIPADSDPVTVIDRGSFSLQHPTYMHLRCSAYAIAPEAARKLISASKRPRCPVDNFLRRTWHHKQPIFQLEPPLFSLTDVSEDSGIGGRMPTPKHRNFLLRFGVRKRRHVYFWWARFASRRHSAKALRALEIGQR